MTQATAPWCPPRRWGSTATFTAGLGDRARADYRIILECIKNSTTQTRTQESNDVAWQKMVNQGSNTETLTLPSFTGLKTPTFTAPAGISVQIPEALVDTAHRQAASHIKGSERQYLPSCARRTIRLFGL